MRKIPTEALDKLLKLVRERLPELRPMEADLMIGLAWDDAGEWAIGARAEADAEAILRAQTPASAMASLRRGSRDEREGDVFLVVRFR